MSNIICVSKLVSSSEEYMGSRSDFSADLVIRHLQEFSVHDDSDTFDPYKNHAPRLYFTLYELVSKLDPNSNVLWAAIKVLQRACQLLPNHSALVEAYKFIPPLTALLDAHLAPEKKTCLLQLLQMLTNNIQCVQNENCLQALTAKLIEIIMNDGGELVHLSLGILVNLCQNNPELVYSLKCFLGNKFFHAVMNLKTEELDTKVQMCKLLYILEPIAFSVEGPSDIARTIIEVTICNLLEAFEKQKISSLNVIVDFFEELTRNPLYKEILSAFDGLAERLGGALEGGGPEGGALRVGAALVRTDAPSARPLRPALARRALAALAAPKDAAPALRLLSALLRPRPHPDLLPALRQHLLVVVRPLSQQMEADVEEALFPLLEELLDEEELREAVVEAVDDQWVQGRFAAAAESAAAGGGRGPALRVAQALSLGAALRAAGGGGGWPQWPGAERAAAGALYDGDARTRCLVLRLAARSSPDAFAKCLAEYQQSKESCGDSVGDKSVDLKNATLLSKVSGGQIDTFLDDLQEEMNENGGVAVSSAMALFEYRVAAKRRAQQVLEAGVAAAREWCAGAEARVVALEAGVRAQRVALLGRQRMSEALAAEARAATRRLAAEKELRAKDDAAQRQEEAACDALAAGKQRLRQQLAAGVAAAAETVSALREAVAAKEVALEAERGRAAARAGQLLEADAAVAQAERDIAERMMSLEELMGRVKVKKQVLEQRDTELKNLKKKESALTAEVADLNMVHEAQLKTASEKDAIVRKLKNELSELKRVRDLITSIASGNSCNESL